MSATEEGTAYVYQNVGLEPGTGVEEGTAYVYQNVGRQARSRIGAVYGSSASHLTPLAYVYQNIT